MKLPIHLGRWIEDHEALLHPPINNKMIQVGEDFFVMAVGGPNARTDYHVNQTEVLLIGCLGNYGFFHLFYGYILYFLFLFLRNGFTS